MGGVRLKMDDIELKKEIIEQWRITGERQKAIKDKLEKKYGVVITDTDIGYCKAEFLDNEKEFYFPGNSEELEEEDSEYNLYGSSYDFAKEYLEAMEKEVIDCEERLYKKGIEIDDYDEYAVWYNYEGRIISTFVFVKDEKDIDIESKSEVS